MAKVLFTDLELEGFGALRTLADLFRADHRGSGVQTGDEVVFTDDRGHKLVFEGDDLTFSGGVFTGTIDAIRITQGDGDIYVEATNVDRDAATVFAALDEDDNTHSMFLKAVLDGKDTIVLSDVDGITINGGRGNDVIVGGDGQDSLFGSFGRDRLTGNGDMDFFSFSKRSGKDVVTDFDAKGGFGQQDLIATTEAMFDNARIVRSGDDTLIDFAGKDSLLLRDVKRSQIDENDFLFF
jgi:Ca2+-binding RTX toxin-like protein